MNTDKKVIRLRKGLVELGGAETNAAIHNTALAVTEKVLNPDLCVLSLDRENTLIARRSVGKTDENRAPSFFAGGVSSLARKKGEVIRGNDPGKDSRFDSNNYRSFVCVPLEGVGSLLVSSFSEDEFTDGDVNLLQILVHNLRDRLLRAEVEGDLRDQAIHDQLTGLYNRHYLEKILPKEAERAQRYGHTLSFLMLDINGFKEVNDTYSHAKGDKVLIEVADLLRDNLREPDTVVRYGGDEFLVLLPETGEGSKVVVKKLKEKMEIWNEQTDTLDFPLSFAIGSSNFDPEEELSIKDKISEADQNMYKDKKIGV